MKFADEHVIKVSLTEICIHYKISVTFSRLDAGFNVRISQIMVNRCSVQYLCHVLYGYTNLVRLKLMPVKIQQMKHLKSAWMAVDKGLTACNGSWLQPLEVRLQP